jgi:hypothetical protein
MKSVYPFLILMLLCLASSAQDKIIKVSGDTIYGKVLEIDENNVSYKKANVPNGPTFTDKKSDIKLIIYQNGKTDVFSKSPVQSQPGNEAAASTNTAGTQNQKHKIQMTNDHYFVDGDMASQRQVNKMLAASKNPAITLPLKAARTTKTIQTIIKITSIPTTIGGGVASLVTGIDLINDVRRTRDHTSTYVNFFSSFLTSISLPITNKILKNKSKKMYAKLIDAYNLTN